MHDGARAYLNRWALWNKLKNSLLEGKTLSWKDCNSSPYVMTKEILQKNYPFGLLQVDRSRIHQYHETFGTTGKPSSNPMTKGDLRSYVDQLDHGPLRLHARDTVMIRYPYSISTPAHLFHRLAQRRGAAVIAAGSRSFVVPHGRIIQLMRDIGVSVLCCMPSEAILLAAIARYEGLSPGSDFPALRAICTAGELLPPGMREFIEGEWNARVYNFYGSTEAGNIAYSDDEGKMRVPAGNFDIAFVDTDSGKTCEAGQFGAMVLTTRKKKALPLLRYLTGDYGYWDTDSAGYFIEIYGRAKERQSLNGKTLFFRDIKDTLFRLAARGEISPFWRWGYGEDKAILSIEEIPGGDKKIRQHFGDHLEIRAVKPHSIEPLDLLRDFGVAYLGKPDADMVRFTEFYKQISQVKKPEYFYPL